MNTSMSIAAEILARAKWAFSTRRVLRADARRLRAPLAGAASGDLVLGRVERIGSHKRIQLAEGRTSDLYVGDLVVLACGDRYAPDQFEGHAVLDPMGADMLAGGGVIGSMRHRHTRMASPTRIVPLGLLTRESGEVVNVAGYALPSAARPLAMPAIGIVGTSMNAGKTTAVAALAHGLGRAGHAVAAIKATGTGAFGDVNAYVDSGAQFVADFTDAGMVSTYRQPVSRIERGLETLLGHAAGRGCTVAVVELADGVVQKETAELLGKPRVRAGFAGLLLASPDALGAAGGCSVLRDMGIEPVAVTGMVSCSPLATAEAEAVAGVRVIGRDALCDPAQASALLARIAGAGGGLETTAGRARGDAGTAREAVA